MQVVTPWNFTCVGIYGVKATKPRHQHFTIALIQAIIVIYSQARIQAIYYSAYSRSLEISIP